MNDEDRKYLIRFYIRFIIFYSYKFRPNLMNNKYSLCILNIKNYYYYLYIIYIYLI